MTITAEVQARSDEVARGLTAGRFPSTHKVLAALGDRVRLLIALRAVEAVHTQELGVTPDGSPADICGGCPSYWPCPTIGAIREALS